MWILNTVNFQCKVQRDCVSCLTFNTNGNVSVCIIYAENGTWMCDVEALSGHMNDSKEKDRKQLKNTDI